jgi:hypothetical protein
VPSAPGALARRPLITTATVAALVSAVLALLTSFGVPLTDAQQAAVSGLAAVLAPLFVALVGHQLVTPAADPRDRAGHPLVPAVPPTIPAPRDPSE